MTRLRAIGLVLGLAVAAQPHPSAAQTARIGFLEPGSPEANRGFLDAFREGLSALGWAEGRNLEILDRWARARTDRLPEIVDELIRSKVDVLVTGASPAT